MFVINSTYNSGYVHKSTDVGRYWECENERSLILVEWYRGSKFMMSGISDCGATEEAEGEDEQILNKCDTQDYVFLISFSMFSYLFNCLY